MAIGKAKATLREQVASWICDSRTESPDELAGEIIELVFNNLALPSEELKLTVSDRLREKWGDCPPTWCSIEMFLIAARKEAVHNTAEDRE